MNNFQFFLNTHVDFGNGRTEVIGEYVKSIGSERAIIVTDSNVIKAGLIVSISKQLEMLDIPYDIFSDVNPNPSVETIDMGAKFLREKESDIIIAVGGGSSMDTAKGMAVLAVNEGSCYDYLDGRGGGKKSIDFEPLPLIAVPTTAGTGSEVSMYSVITDKNCIKDSLTTPYIYPKIAIVDPQMTLKLPKYPTAFTGLDVLGHALEAYTSRLQNRITNIWALEAIKLVFENLPGAVNKGILEYRESMSLASLIAGSAMSHCGATLPHALGCPLSGHYDIPHGLTVGILQIPMIEYNKDILGNEFATIVRYIEKDLPNNEKNYVTVHNSADILISKIHQLFNKIGVDEILKGINIDTEGMKALVHDASVHGCLGLNQREMIINDIEAMYMKVIER